MFGPIQYVAVAALVEIIKITQLDIKQSDQEEVFFKIFIARNIYFCEESSSLAGKLNCHKGPVLCPATPAT